jgi:coproporphyrinogen III oxidase
MLIADFSGPIAEDDDAQYRKGIHENSVCANTERERREKGFRRGKKFLFNPMCDRQTLHGSVPAPFWRAVEGPRAKM